MRVKDSDVLLSLVRSPPTEYPSLKILAARAGVSDKTMGKILKGNRLGEFRVCLNYPLLRIFTILVYCESSRPVPEEEFKDLPFVEEVYIPDSFKNEYYIKAKVPKYSRIFSVLKHFRQSLDMDYFVTSIAYEYAYDNLMPQDSKYFEVERVRLGEKDWRILASLNENVLKKLSRVSEETGIPTQTVSYRLNKLKEQNVILGYPLLPDIRAMEKAGLRTYIYLARRWDPLDFGEEVINISMHRFHAGYNLGGIAIARSSAVLKKGLRGSDKAVVYKLKGVIRGNWIEGVLDERFKGS